jgi:hypothetical protein
MEYSIATIWVQELLKVVTKTSKKLYGAQLNPAPHASVNAQNAANAVEFVNACVTIETKASKKLTCAHTPFLVPNK